MTDELIELRNRLINSHLEFTKVFFELKTGRPFHTPEPVSRASHYKVISKELEDVFDLKTNRLIINVPPGHGKSTLLVYFVAWVMSQYPDSQILYVSYSRPLAEKHTATIKEIMEMPQYYKLFGVKIDMATSARGNFKTLQGGRVMAFGSGSSITGMDAGLPYLERFSGMVIMDDMHKPDDVHSDSMREHVIDNYNQTIKPRPRGPNVPIVFLGQRLHEADIAAFLLESKDGINWRRVVLRAIDEAGNALCPSINPLEMLLREQEVNPYVFSSQYQQDPQPAGGGIFKPEWFVLLDDEPEIISTFITADTAETDKTYNDATVFSFWGLYKIMHRDVDTGLYGLHWLDCAEVRVEPHDLERELFSFYTNAMRHKVKPEFIAIEKKSTGVTLASSLKNIQGLRAIDIERSAVSKNKIDRFFSIQSWIAKRHVSLPRYGKHTHMCLEHCRKITGNNTHRFDDICDTLYDAVKLGLIDKVLLPKNTSDSDKMMRDMAAQFNQVNRMRMDRQW